MAGRGAVRGALTAWLGLVVLQVLTTDRGSAATAGAFDSTTELLKRAMSPDVPAIPDRRDGAADETPAPRTPWPTGGLAVAAVAAGASASRPN